MHLAFLNTLYPPHGSAGAETSLRLLIASLVARGHRCDVLTLAPGPAATRGEVDGVPVHYLPLANVYWPHGGARPRGLRPVFQAIEAWNPVMQRRLRATLETLRPDVLHCHNLQGFTAAAWTAAHAAGIPVVQTLHDYYTACPRSAMWRPGRGNCQTLCTECRIFGAPRRRLSRLPDAVTCVSHRVMDRLVAAGAFPDAATGRQPARIIRGNNASDELPHVPANSPPGAPLRLGFIGRLDPSKGVERLLDAVAALPPGSVALQVAGSGQPDYLAALKARAPNCVRFLGHVKPSDFFPAIDLLVIPSVWEDPFPRVFHEALAYGVPSLVGAGGGVPEVIQDGKTGFLMPADETGPVTASLRRLIDAPWDRASVSAACRAEAARYAPSFIAAQYEAVLQATADRRPVGPDAGEPWRGAVPHQTLTQTTR